MIPYGSNLEQDLLPGRHIGERWERCTTGPVVRRCSEVEEEIRQKLIECILLLSE
jgi:hypothetical protein